MPAAVIASAHRLNAQHRFAGKRIDDRALADARRTDERRGPPRLQVLAQGFEALPRRGAQRMHRCAGDNALDPCADHVHVQAKVGFA